MQKRANSSSHRSMAYMSAIHSILTPQAAVIATTFRASARRGFAAGHDLACRTAGEGLAGPVGRAPDCGRSGAAGDANSGRALVLSPRPVGTGEPAWARGGCLGLHLTLTPTRWRSKRLAGQSRASNGAGDRFQAGTAVEPCWNRQLPDIASYFARFQRFQLGASRDAHVCVREQTRAYTRGHFVGTLEPYDFIFRDHIVKGSTAVPNRFQLGTAVVGFAPCDGKPSNINILAVGYSSDLGQWACSTVIRGRAGETFGLERTGCASAGPIGGLDLVHQARSPWCSENGGFPPISGAWSAHVGRVMLERWVQGTAIAALSAPRRLPVRLTRPALAEAPGGAVGPSAPPLAPIAPALPPSMPAHQRGQIWNGSAFRHHGSECSPAGRREAWGGMIGSGCRVAGRETRKSAAGRGCGGGVLRAPGRRAHGRTGGAGVN